MTVVKIYIKPHLAEYMTGKFWDEDLQAIRMPDNDDLYITIFCLTAKRPLNARIDEGNLFLCLPDRRDGKDPAYWNYLPSRAVREIEKRIETRFKAELHDYLDEQKHRYGIDYLTAIDVFLHRYDITSISDEALRKDYYRWRDKVRGKMEVRAYKKTPTKRHQ